MTLGVPQLCMLSIIFLNLGINLAKDGEEKEEKYSFIYAFFGACLQIFILYKGGFFS